MPTVHVRFEGETQSGSGLGGSSGHRRSASQTYSRNSHAWINSRGSSQRSWCGGHHRMESLGRAALKVTLVASYGLAPGDSDPISPAELELYPTLSNRVVSGGVGSVRATLIAMSRPPQAQVYPRRRGRPVPSAASSTGGHPWGCTFSFDCSTDHATDGS
jgi:hypothetical protein